MLEETLVAIIVGLATLILLLRILRWRPSAGGCAGCGCNRGPAAQADRLGKRRELIQVDLRQTSAAAHRPADRQ